MHATIIATLALLQLSAAAPQYKSTPFESSAGLIAKPKIGNPIETFNGVSKQEERDSIFPSAEINPDAGEERQNKFIDAKERSVPTFAAETPIHDFDPTGDRSTGFESLAERSSGVTLTGIVNKTPIWDFAPVEGRSTGSYDLGQPSEVELPDIVNKTPVYDLSADV
ncbi:hypothetical protein BD289DRAFT_484542 [Coniella lustricola]|uniref:Uncharacterized protein n=1 Tax=Coniella lustricola TaxID=2025994 RepID=A0A2T3A1M9_9PEZI|nr:hypothetical protein BD289DRAFT_484542 [Coniella lustricola]